MNNCFDKAIRYEGIKKLCESTLSSFPDGDCGLQLKPHVIHSSHDIDEVVSSSFYHILALLKLFQMEAHITN